MKTLIAIGFGVAALATTDRAPTASWTERYRSVELAIPAGDPRGTVELASFGRVALAAEGEQVIDATHVRIAVTNEGDIAPWTVDLPDTTLAVPGGPRVHAIAINSDLKTLPAVVVGLGDRRTVDLYFPTPGNGDLELAWRVTTPTSEIHDSTRLVRESGESTELLGGWGARWWFDRSYPWATYFHHDGVIVPRPPESATVTLLRDEPANPCDQW